MKRIFSGLLTTFIFFICAFNVQAQTKQTLTEWLTSEIIKLRSDLIKSIKSSDRKTLEAIYADDFTHTHASGQVDDKTKRIAALLSNEPTIESADADEMNIRIYGKTTVVVVGQSTVQNKDGSAAKYRWTTVYFKTKNSWQIVASQATRLAEK